MPAPSIAPQNFYVQTANRQNLLTWDYISPLVSAVLNYDVQRSTDGLNFTSTAAPTINSFLDNTTTVGTAYYYKIAAVNADGTGPYTDVQVAIPAPTGEMSLGHLRVSAKQRADMLHNDFITLPEWNQMINQSIFELYDLLITTYEDYFVADPVLFTTSGNNVKYDLPNGVNYNGAAPFYKLLGVDVGLNTYDNAYLTVHKFNFADRNKWFYPNTPSSVFGVTNVQYRVMNNQIYFIPPPAASQPVRVWYIPRLTELLQDTDVTSASISGWSEYVIVDAAIKAMQKEESDVSVLAAQKGALISRIQSSAMNRDAGKPDTISDTRTANTFWSDDGWGQDGGIF